jgi:hypothetical protein
MSPVKLSKKLIMSSLNVSSLTTKCLVCSIRDTMMNFIVYSSA